MLLGKKNCILQQQSMYTSNPYLPLHLLLFQPEFRLDFSMRSIGKLIIQSFVFHVFLQCCLLSLYQVYSQTASTANLSQLCQLSASCISCLIPEFVQLWFQIPQYIFSCLILIISFPFPFCPPSTSYRIIRTSVWLQEKGLPKTI